MNSALPSPFHFSSLESKKTGRLGAKDLFRIHFKREFCRVLKSGQHVEHAFGQIWEQTLESIRLTEQEHAELYEELIRWAKDFMF